MSEFFVDLNGWESEIDGHGKHRLTALEASTIPKRVRHNETAFSEDYKSLMPFMPGRSYDNARGPTRTPVRDDAADGSHGMAGARVPASAILGPDR